MTEQEVYDDMEQLTDEQRDALDQLHGWMSHRIAEAHVAGDRAEAEYHADWRQEVSGMLSQQTTVGGIANDAGQNERELMEERRQELTRELHDAVAWKDGQRAARLDRERNELTDELYGNGAVVGAGGRSL